MYKGTAGLHDDGKPLLVAVKLVLPGVSTDKGMEDLLKETAFASDHPHPHVVRVIGYCESPMAMVCELMAGGDLQQTLESPQKLADLSLLQRVQILAHTASGLAHLHANGILHKDVKHLNIMLKWQPQECGGQPQVVAKVSDLGLSK